MKVKIIQDGKKCEYIMSETKKGFRVKTQGKNCKKMLGKDYFEEVQMEYKS